MPEVSIGKIEERGASRSTPATLHRLVMRCLFDTLTRRRSGVRIPVAGTSTYSISTVFAGRHSRGGSVEAATWQRRQKLRERSLWCRLLARSGAGSRGASL